MYELVVHLGAHRTGSTSLQAALREDQALLQTLGVVCLTPEAPGYRRSGTLRDFTNITIKAVLPAAAPVAWLRRQMRITRRRRQARRVLADLIGPQQPFRLILSDENLMGPVFDYTNGPSIYPLVKDRLNNLVRTLGHVPDRVVIAIRPYDTFIPSAYAMYAAYVGELPGFDTLRPTPGATFRGWPEVIADIRAALPGARLDIFPIDRVSAVDIRQALLGLEGNPALSPIHSVNAAPTRQALTYINAARPLSHAQIDALIDAHGQGEKIAAYTVEETAYLKDVYGAHLVTLGLI